MPHVSPHNSSAHVLLQQDLVCLGVYGAIHEAVVREQPNLWIHNTGKVIYMEQEQQWSDDCPLGHSQARGYVQGQK